MGNRFIWFLFIFNCGLVHTAEDAGCFEKWLQGYRLAIGRPQQTYATGTLAKCQAICEREQNCAALAFGTSGAGNGTCELAIRSLRDSRSVNNTSNALNYDEIKKASQYDIYVMSSSCIPRQPLFASHSQSTAVGNGVPIDCFYRLMSGKRVAKNHVFKSISVKDLQECQEACIEDRSCRSLNFRYMMTGYTYNVANCELSPFYIVNYDDTRRSAHEFIDDYDYDYFQREPHCKTTSPLGYSGVCAMVVKRGSKLSPNLIKFSHTTSTTAQCEFQCQTASRFRCRAFAVRHTTRGRLPFNRDQDSEATCVLYDADISRLPHYEIIPDPDFDLFEIGRLMGTECVLYDQYLNRRPNPDSFKHTHYEPANRDRPYERPGYEPPGYDRPRLPYPPRPYELGNANDREHHNSRRPISFYPPEDRSPSINDGFPKPGDGGNWYPGISSSLAPASSANDLPYYDSRREGNVWTSCTTPHLAYALTPQFCQSSGEACLVKFNQDVYLSPEVTRAQFPAKSLEECRVECIRSMEVLRFPCRCLSYRLTSNSGGSCQLSEYYMQELRANDFVPARDRYENAVVYHYDEADALCRRRYDDDRDRYGGSGSRDRIYPERDRIYPDRDRYPQTDGRYGSGGYYGGGSRYGSSGSYGGSTQWKGVNSGYTPGSAYVVPSRDTNYQRPLYDRDTRYPYGQPQGTYGGSYIQDTREYLPRPDSYGREQTQTVNGEKCLRSCVQDREAGFYYCLLDTRGTWDFCCRPDHFCGHSRGVSVPWCYVGSGPTAQIWRSCQKRSIGHILEPPIQYLHEGPPPTIHSLSTDAAAALSKDNALQLLKSDLKNKHDSPDFEDIDGDNEQPSQNSATELIQKAGSHSGNGTEIYYGNMNNEPTLLNSTNRQLRLISKHPSFTVVEVKSSKSSTV